MKLNELASTQIFEDQKFNFAPIKDNLRREIKKLIANPTDKDAVKSVQDLIYSVVVNDVEFAKIGNAKKVGLDDAAVNAWKNYFSSKYFNTGGGGPWAQVDFNSSVERKTGKDRTLNYYITVDRTPENVAKFLKNFNSLITAVRDFSNAQKTPISFKTHRHLDYFVTHNDSLKFYYYDPDVEKGLVAVAKKWLSDSGIKTGARTHEFGVDKTEQGDDKKSSFGQVLSKHISSQFISTIGKNGSKYSEDQYITWLETHLPSLIKQVEVKK